MSRLELFLFGQPHLEQDGQPVEIDARKTMALLAYMAVTGASHGRETLLTLLWPEFEPRRAQNVLRRNLSVLNKTLDGQWLLVERDIIGLDRQTDAWLDVAHFRRLAHAWHEHDHPEAETCADCLDTWAEAVNLYRADFLAGFSVRNSSNFDDWQLLETEQLKRELAWVLERLVRGHSDRQEFELALNYAQRWLALDALHEPAHRHLMQLYARTGDRSAALRQYHNCVQLLARELGVRPQAETTVLYQRLQQEAEHHRKIIGETFAIIDGDTAVGLENNLLGYGGMGQVYRGLHIQTGEPVAIKVLKPEIVATNPDLVARFVREGEALRQLNHPNIVKMLAASEQDGRHFLVMEYVGGGSLRDLIKEQDRLPLSRVLEYGLDLADALARAHRLNIIHRDLKPANVLLAEDGTPRLTDFGLARRLDSSVITETGVIFGTLEYLSPEGCEGQRLDERADIWALGVILFEMLTGVRPFKGETLPATLTAILTQPLPELSQYRSDIPASLVDLIGRMLAKEPAERLRSVRLVGAELEAIIADRPLTPIVPVTPAGPPPLCPYRGLFAFQEEDAPFFFGREAFTRQLVEAVQDRPLVAIVGPSGSGKSSVVYAGLIAQLRQDRGRGAEGLGSGGAGEQGCRGAEERVEFQFQNLNSTIQNSAWLIADFRPGSDPFQSLAASLLPHLEPDLSETERLVEIRKLAQSLQGGELLLVDVIERILQKSSVTGRLLLVADQFEELYTLVPEPDTGHNFLDLLLDLIELQAFQPTPTSTFVFTLRADFLEQVLAYRPLADTIQDADFMLGPMTGEELSRAVERPAEKQGVTFESGLVERILDDVGEEPGNLPLLEFALTALWEQQQARLLTHSGYEVIDRVNGALTHHADQVYAGLDSSEQATARRILIQLVRPGQGTEDTRRVARREELSEVDWALVQRLADSRLVVTGLDAGGQEVVEVVHEALIRSWGRLRDWMDDDRSFRRWQERLRAAMRQWAASEQDEGALLRGVPLAEAENWLSQRRLDLSEAEREFIQTSLALRDRKVAEREAQLRRELEVAQERAEEQARAAASLRRRSVWLVGVGLVAVLLAIAAGVFGLQATVRQREAEQQARRAHSAQLATQTQNVLNRGEDPSVSLPLMLAREAVLSTLTEDGYVTLEADAALRLAINAAPPWRMTLHHMDVVNSAAFSPDGQTVVTASRDGTVRLWDVATGEEIRRFEGHTESVRTAAFSPDGQTIATASMDDSARLWDVATGEEIRRFEGHTDWVRSAAFSSDGQTIVTASRDSTIRLWDVATGQQIQRLPGRTPTVNSAAFSPDGKTVVTTGRSFDLTDTAAQLLDMTTGQQTHLLEGHTDELNSATFSPDGQTIVTASGGETPYTDNSIRFWDPTTGEEIDRIEGQSDWVNSAAFSPDGRTIVSASNDRTARLWDVATGQEILRLEGHTDWVNTAVFSPDGQRIVTTSWDGTARLWNVVTNEKVRRLEGHEQEVNSVRFSPNPNNQIIVTASADRNACLWNTATGRQIRCLEGRIDEVNFAAFSPDGQTIVTAHGSALGGDKTARLWNVATGEEIGRFEGHTEIVNSADFSPDGRTIVTASNDQTARLWNVASGEEIRRLEGHADEANSAVFSPDSQSIVTASNDQTARLWDVATGEEIRRLEGHTGWVNTAAFSPDGQTIVTASNDQTARLWNVATGEEIRRLELHSDWVNSAIFSPDGKRIVTASDDNSVVVWDVATGKVIRRLDGHMDMVFSAAFSPDGQTIVSASADNTARVWPGIEVLLDDAKTLIQRDPPEFTPEERVRFGLGGE